MISWYVHISTTQKLPIAVYCVYYLHHHFSILCLMYLSAKLNSYFHKHFLMWNGVYCVCVRVCLRVCVCFLSWEHKTSMSCLTNSPACNGSCCCVRAYISNPDHGLNDFYSAINVRVIAWPTGGRVWDYVCLIERERQS